MSFHRSVGQLTILFFCFISIIFTAFRIFRIDSCLVAFQVCVLLRNLLVAFGCRLAVLYFQSCAKGSKMVHYNKRLSESEGKVFLDFFLKTNTLCHQLK